MRVRALGRTGLAVSEIGFGCWGLGGAYGPPPDEPTAVSLLRHALDRGITFYDTAPIYGDGLAEERLGAAFRDRRDRVVLATKVGYRRADSAAQDFSSAFVRESVHGSLRRLRTDYVDLLQLHDPPPGEGLSRVLNDLVAAGKVRALGVSLRRPSDGASFLGDARIAAVQVNYNLTDRRAEDCGLFDDAARAGAGLIIRTPLVFGFLADSGAARADFATGDHRRRWSQAQKDLWSAARERFARLAVDRTPAQFALSFCLARPDVSTAIPGMLDIAQVDENAAAGSLPPLSWASLRELDEVRDGGAFFLG